MHLKTCVIPNVDHLAQYARFPWVLWKYLLALACHLWHLARPCTFTHYLQKFQDAIEFPPVEVHTQAKRHG